MVILATARVTSQTQRRLMVALASAGVTSQAIDGLAGHLPFVLDRQGDAWQMCNSW